MSRPQETSVAAPAFVERMGATLPAPESFGEVFPFFIAFDRELRVVGTGTSIARVDERIVPGASLPSLVSLRSPEGSFDFETLLGDPHTLFVLEGRGGLLLRGQVVRTVAGGGGIFLGSPWLTQADDLLRFGLRVSDFAVHDATIDLLNVAQAQRVALGDARKLATKLSSQREALREREAKLLAITASVPGVVFELALDREGMPRFEFISAGVLALLGTSPEEASAQPLSVFSRIHPADRLGVLDALRSTAETLEPWHADFRIRAVAGTRWLSGQAIPRRTADGGTVWTGVLVDVTLQKEAEIELAGARDAAVAASRIKSEFLANMSHEIRTPMNGVIGMIGLLLETSLSDRQRALASGVQSSADALLTVINDILDFSKIEAGKLELEHIRFDLRDCAESVIDLLAEAVTSKGLQLGCVIARDVPDVVKGDPGRLRQVVTNLLGNAVKFTAQGTVSMAVSIAERTRRDDREMATLYFEVSDTGIGIPVETQARLFEPFSQGDGSITRQYGGTGLGLAISSQLVRLMGGEIGVHSEPGSGSTFWFTLPLEVAEAASDADAEVLNGRRVLIVDDHPMNRRVLREQLRAWGVETASAASGDEALARALDEAAAGRPFDVALFDMRMPGMSGVALAQTFHAHPELAAIPLVLLTSWKEAEVEGGREFHATLPKPVRSAVLRETLVGVLTSVPRRASPTGGTAVDARGRATPRSLPAMLESHAPDVSNLAGRPRVLLVEDNVINQFIAIEYLKPLQVEVVSAGDGHAAIDAFRAAPVDLILMDCQMPGLDGFGATRAIRDLEGRAPAAGRVPILALTANAMRGDREECLAAGMDDYLSKPLDREQFLAAVQRWLGVARSARGER